ncbi:MAG: hypothetical protein PF961_23745 [Planctomycetota bacterium]|jgi:hypothetical protein|nr:hypothetical protein [Planctomycetota bacterium]
MSRLLRMLALLAACSWTAVNAVLVGVAMTAFGVLKAQLDDLAGRKVAGQVFGQILDWWTNIAWILAIAAAVGLALTAAMYWYRAARVRPVLLIVLLAAMLGCHAVASLQVSEVAEARAALEDRDPRDDPAFSKLHKASERVFALETILALVATLALATSLVPRDRLEVAVDAD